MTADENDGGARNDLSKAHSFFEGRETDSPPHLNAAPRSIAHADNMHRVALKFEGRNLAQRRERLDEAGELGRVGDFGAELHGDASEGGGAGRLDGYARLGKEARGVERW